MSDLSIAMAATPDPVLAGETLTYTITVSNHGPDPATGVEVVDLLPPEVSLLATSGCEEDPIGVPTCGLGTVAAGDTASYTITVTVDPGATGSITNTATVGLASDAALSAAADPDDANNVATAAVDVTALAAELTVVKSAPPAITLGDSIVFTITVTNNGTAAADVVVADPTCDTAPQRLTDDADGRLGPGETWTYTCALTPSTAGPVTNTATVVSTDVLGVVTTGAATAQVAVSGPVTPIAFTGVSVQPLLVAAGVTLVLGAAALLGRRRLLSR